MAPSELWRMFTKVDQFSASCNECKKVIKTSGNTSNLKSHMDKHLKKTEDWLNAPKTSKLEQQKMSEFVSYSGVEMGVNSTNIANDPDVKKKLFIIIY